jgi:16S rRNA (cytosine967-C5)-methyltransferase
MTPRSSREAALEILLKITKQKAYSQIVLNDVLEKSPFEGKDRGLISQMVYGVVQQRMTLEYYLSHFLKKKSEA